MDKNALKNWQLYHFLDLRKILGEVAQQEILQQMFQKF